MMKMRLTTAPDIEAMTWAIGRKNSLLNNGIETTVRYMMTARMNMRTKLIWKQNLSFLWHKKDTSDSTSKRNILWSDTILTMKHIRPAPTTTRFNLRLSGKWGSLIPVIGFFSKNGALAANSGLGRSSSSLKPMQSQWWARLAFLRFQYSKNVTAEKSLNIK